MKTLVLNFYKKTVLATDAKQAIEFINSLDGISANASCIKNLEDYFLGINKYPLSQIATTGCGASRINCYPALSSTLDAHNEIIEQRKIDAKNKAVQEFNEIKEGEYEVTIKCIRLERGTFYRTITTKAISKNDAYCKISSDFWDKNTENVVQIICTSVYFLN